ncbi:MAG: hypothetical protein RIQ93_2173 [Verrucomicrobiota bacterium]|jgi:hypothetical protein
MRTKVTLVLIFLNVALFFFIFKFERNWRTEAASLEARRRVLGSEAADIRSLEVTSTAPGGSFGLVRHRDAWMLTKPLDWPANPNAVRSIINELQFLEHETSFPTKDLGKNNNPTFADYGVEKPKLTVAFTSGDPAAASGPLPPTILRIGDTTKVGNRLYLLSPDGARIHVVNRSLIDSLSLPLDQLRADELLTIPVFEARSLFIQTLSTGVRVRIRRDNIRWNFEAPIVASGSRTAIELTFNKLNRLRAKTFAPPPPAVLPMSAPEMRITIEGNGRSETLFIGSPVAEATPPTPTAPAPAAPAPPASGTAKKGDVEYYAQLENRSPLFTVMVSAELSETLRAATTELRERRIVEEFDAHSVTAITLVSPARGGLPVTLQRLDPTTAEGGIWQIVYRGEGQNRTTTPADRALVERFLTQLSQLSAKNFVSDNPSSAELENWGFNRPEREVTLELASLTVPGAPSTATSSAAAATTTTRVLQLGTDGSRRVFARVNPSTNAGSSIFGLEVDLAAEFPVEPTAWRDRSLPAIPVNARITALKLTDLVSGKPVLETSLEAEGRPGGEAREAQAVQTLVAQVRHPRAKNFRPGPFTDKVLAGAEERSWRYQLDATFTAATEQTRTRTLYFADRTGGSEQLAGSKEFDSIFEVEQPLLDALWAIVYGPRDPGPQPPKTN